jgi:hypothetical protein
VNDSTPSPTLQETGRVARPWLAKDQTGWLRWLPGLHVLRHCELAWLLHDVMAGLALSAARVPVGIAYAVASGVPGICGPSRILVLGPDSSLAALILAVVLPLSAGDPQQAIALAGMMALVSGALCVAAGAARLGFVTELLSKPIRHAAHALSTSARSLDRRRRCDPCRHPAGSRIARWSVRARRAAEGPARFRNAFDGRQ